MNAICDVAGVSVGHATLDADGAHTGVTAILPHAGDINAARLPAGAAVLNGFGKSAGLIQLQELGQIEAPILLTNTFGVATCTQALIRRAIAADPRIGRSAPTVNPLVLECNDGRVNDIQAMAVSEAMALAAIDAAGPEFAQGTVGAGTGMCTFGFAGGIGSASRRVMVEGAGDFTLGALVLSNFGEAGQLRVLGRHLPGVSAAEPDKGSIIIVMATDAPLDARQLTRLSRRAAPALGRLGSYMGHGSGDIALAFSTANQIAQTGPIENITRLGEGHLNPFFHAAVETVEEAVLHAMWFATPRRGYDGTVLPILRDALGQINGAAGQD